MGAFFFILALVFAIVLYGVSSIVGRERVQGVEAGPIDNSDISLLRHRSFYSPRLRICDENGKTINSKDMIRVVVCGNCMRPRKIFDNSQLLVQKINPNKLEEELKQDDIIMIHLKDKNIDKIRVFDHFDNNKQLVTYRYDDNSKRKDSSRPHSPSSVVGIVKYKL